MRLKEIVGGQRVPNEKEAINLIRSRLYDKGVPPGSISIEHIVGVAARADLAILNEERTDILALIELKISGGTNKMRRLREATLQLQHYIHQLSPARNLLAFAVICSPGAMEIFEIPVSEGETRPSPISDFPTWDEIRSDHGAFRGLATRLSYSGSNSEERQKLANCFAEARRELRLLTKELALSKNGGDLSQLQSILGEIDSQLNFRFRDLGTPRPWRSQQQLFQSIALFGRQLRSFDAILQANDVQSGTDAYIGAKTLLNTILDGISAALEKPEIAAFLKSASWLVDDQPEKIRKPARAKRPVDLLIITAMHAPEYGEVQSIMSSPTFVDPFPHGNNKAIVQEGHLVGGNPGPWVVTATQDDMGLTNAAVLATKLIVHFQPKYVAMVGIAAGINSKTQKIGDILCATHTYDLAMGKLEREGKWSIFKPKIYQKGVQDHFDKFSAYLEIKTKQTLLNDIKDLWDKMYPGSKLLKTAPKLHTGPFGSGGSVIADSKEVAIYKGANYALIGFDMETHAVVTAATECGLPNRPQPIILKSICDFAGDDKASNKDNKQRLAAFTSAQFLRLLALNYLDV